MDTSCIECRGFEPQPDSVSTFSDIMLVFECVFNCFTRMRCHHDAECVCVCVSVCVCLCVSVCVFVYHCVQTLVYAIVLRLCCFVLFVAVLVGACAVLRCSSCCFVMRGPALYTQRGQQTHTPPHTPSHTRKYPHTQPHTHTFTHTHTHTSTHTHKHPHTRTHTHRPTHTHTY